MLTDNQKKLLTEYMGEEWDVRCHRNYTTSDDKDALLRAIDKKDEFRKFHIYAHDYWDRETNDVSFVHLFTFLSPLETAKLVCRWKGWE